MQIQRLSLLEGARQARGLAIVIDVFRAFSVAAYVFDKGARDIVLVGEAQQAFALKQRFPDAILIGEIGGRNIAGFDFGNSPTHIVGAARDFTGRRFIQRTSAGTQGVVNALGADEIVLGNFLCARAMVEHVRQRKPAIVSMVAMGDSGVAKTDEDEACAELLAARLSGEAVDGQAFIARARSGQAGRRFLDNHPDAPTSDVDYCLQLDKFDFVMTVAREDDLLVAKRVAYV